MKPICLLLGLSLPCLPLPLQEDQAAPTPAPIETTPSEFEVFFLANEGFLLRAGDDAVLIDAFLGEAYVGYGYLAAGPLEDLLDGRAPLDSVDLALASHVHRDHFQGEVGQRWLHSRTEGVLASSPQVIDALLEAEGPGIQGERFEDLLAFLPEAGDEEEIQVEGVHVSFLRLSHGTGRFATIQNLGHVITLGGVRALHVGDAAMVPGNFAPYDLPSRGIDVVFVPYWYFEDPAGREIIQDHFRPAQLVACHIPPKDLETVAGKLGGSHPDVWVPRTPLERARFRDLVQTSGK